MTASGWFPIIPTPKGGKGFVVATQRRCAGITGAPRSSSIRRRNAYVNAYATTSRGLDPASARPRGGGAPDQVRLRQRAWALRPSDHHLGGAVGGQPPDVPRERARPDRERRHRRARGERGGERAAVLAAGALRQREIGRASCRGRVEMRGLTGP